MKHHHLTQSPARSCCAPAPGVGLVAAPRAAGPGTWAHWTKLFRVFRENQTIYIHYNDDDDDDDDDDSNNYKNENHSKYQSKYHIQ